MSLAASSPSPSPAVSPEIKQQRVLLAVLLLTGTFCVVEAVVGVITRRLVLQADALHLLMDVLALMVSLIAMRLSLRPPTARFTFGLHRAEALAAVLNAGLVLAGVVYIVREGIEGLSATQHEASFGLTAGVSVAALCVNGLSAFLLMRGIAAGHHGHGHGHAHAHGHAPAPRKQPAAPRVIDEHRDHVHEDGDPVHRHARAHDAAEHAHDHAGHDHAGHDHAGHDHAGHDHAGHGHAEDHEHDHEADHSLNLRGAWLHVLGDALGSFAALSTSLAIHFGAPGFVDPLASFLVAGILMVGAGRVLRDAAMVLLEGAPSHLSVAHVRETIAAVQGVGEVLDVRLWTLGAGKDAAAVRLRGDDLAVAARVELRLRDVEELTHVWVHVEPPEVPSVTPGRLA